MHIGQHSYTEEFDPPLLVKGDEAEWGSEDALERGEKLVIIVYEKLHNIYYSCF